jgi:ribonucleoside-triphosphate reductase (thioredoxin)
VLQELRGVARETNAEFADLLGIEHSKAITCVKPSGTVSLLVNSTSGIHYGYGEWIRRRIRNDMKDPVTQFLIESGVEWEPCVMKPDTTAVFSFYLPSSDVTVNSTTAVENCKMVKLFSEEWCDHNPSCTVNVKDSEWMSVGAWLYENFDSAIGMSFMPWFDSHTYQQAPIEPISKEEFDKHSATQPRFLDWQKLAEIEGGKDNVERTRDLACVSGVCEIT